MNKKLIFDAHTHFNDDSYNKKQISLNNIIKEAQCAGVGYFLNCGFDVESSVLAIQQASNYDNVFVAVGIHPMDIKNHPKEALLKIEEMAKHDKVVAIGEVGLDYYWNKDNVEDQINWFKNQKLIAEKYNLALMLHIRDEKDVFIAYDDMLEILKNEPFDRVIVHCFSANTEYAKKFLALGCYINIGGAVTFKNAKTLQEAVKIIPLNRLLVETDSPYLTPHPFRGQLNFSKLITYTVEKISYLKDITYQEVVEQTTENAFSVFNISKK